MPADEPQVDVAKSLRRYRTAARWLGAGVVALTVASLVGWAVDSPILEGVSPAFVPLMPNTAVALAAAGVGLFLLAGDASSRLRSLVAVASAAVAGAIGAVALVEHATGRGAWLDAVLLPRACASAEYPCGRPSLHAALALVIAASSIALLATRRDRAHRAAQTGGAAVAMSGLVGVAAYASGKAPLFGVPGFVPLGGVSVNASFALLFLGAGVLSARPDVGLVSILTSERLGGVVARRSLLVALAVPVVVASVVMGGAHLGFYDDRGAAALLAATGTALAATVLVVAARSMNRLDEERRATEERYRALFEQASDGIFVADIDGRYTDVNASGCRLLGRSREEIVGKTIMDIIPPDDVARLARTRDALLAGESDVAEWTLLRGDGSPVPVEVSAKILPDGRWQGFVRDVTERKRAAREVERALRAEANERARLEAVLEQLPEAVALYGTDGSLVRANRAARAIAVHANGNLGFDFRSPEGAELAREEAPDVRLRERGAPTTGRELAVRTPREELRPVLVSAIGVVDESGERIGGVLLLRDTTAQKELERMRKEWVTVVAHDLRQPLNALSIHAQLLARATKGQGGDVADSVARIRASLRQLDEMIGDLVDMSRLQANQLAVKPREIRVEPLVSAAIERAGLLPSEHPVRVEQNGEPLSVVADPSRIEQVIANLLSNAAKYGLSRTEIRVDVTYREDEVEIAVTNRGAGIPPEEQEKLFHRFARTAASRASGVPGIGVGLYICRGLVEAHGGRIWVESEPGEETSFRFVLPARASSEAAREVPRLLEARRA